MYKTSTLACFKFHRTFFSALRHSGATTIFLHTAIMLTQNNLKLSIKNLHLYSSVGFFPTGIGTDGLPTEASAKEKRRVWRFLLTVSFLYTIFMAVRLKHVLERENGTNKSDNMYTVSLHAIMLVGGVGAVVVHTLLWRSSKVWLNLCLLKDLLQGLPKGNVVALKIYEFERLKCDIDRSSS